jgi:hypothetical protein
MSQVISEVFGVRPPTVFNYKGGTVECINPTQIVGFELETERVDTWANWREVREQGTTSLLNACGIQSSTDGSLRGMASEFITKPMQLTHALHALGRFFEDTKFDEHNYTDRTSVHIHANCTDMTQDQLAALALLYSVVEEVLFEFVGHHRATNIFCVPWYQCLHHSEVVYNCLTAPGNMRNWQKYTALNFLTLTKYGTVEFRHMHGTSDMDKITKWANIISSLMMNAKSSGFAAIAAEIGELNNNSQYRAFFERVLSNQLPFEERYSFLLETGIIQAKYSIFKNNTESKKRPLPTPAPATIPRLVVARDPASGQSVTVDTRVHHVRDLDNGEYELIIQHPQARPQRQDNQSFIDEYNHTLQALQNRAAPQIPRPIIRPRQQAVAGN